MVQLQKDLDKISAAGVQVVGVSYDSVDVLRAFAESGQITFPLLSDVGSQTINAYGLHFENGLPHPGTVLIDQQGIIRAKIFLDGYRDRHSTQDLMDAASKL